MQISKKIVAIALALVMIVTQFSLIGFSEEKETSEIPEGYVGIYTKDDLDNIRLDMAGKYILMNDIVFNNSDYVNGGNFYNSGKGWTPIGTPSTKFTGTFDGNGHAIHNLYINDSSSDYMGLFGYISGATIKNISLKNTKITGKEYVGGITGYSEYHSIIAQCSVTGSITGTNCVGGIVGRQFAFTYSSIIKNYIKNCNNAATINATSHAGGIVGSSAGYYYTTSKYGECLIQYCSNSGSVFATDHYCGGIIGYSYGTNAYQRINSCYNIGNINAPLYAGGLIGCPAGYNFVFYSYSIGTVTSKSNFGGCFGSAIYSSTYCYHLDKAVVNPTNNMSTPISEEQLKNSSTFLEWNFNSVWTMDGREDYPYPELINTPLILPEDSTNHEHLYFSVITDPTCEEPGYTTHTCACGDSYKDDETTATGHTEITITSDPTYTADGYIKIKCLVCDKEINNTVLPALKLPTILRGSSQISFNMKGETYAGSFNVRTIAGIMNEEFESTFGANGEKIKKIGFVYAVLSKVVEPNMNYVKAIVENDATISNYTNKEVNNISTTFINGYHTFACLVKDIPDSNKNETLVAVAYVAWVEDGVTYYAYYNTPKIVSFADLYDAYYPYDKG